MMPGLHDKVYLFEAQRNQPCVLADISLALVGRSPGFPVECGLKHASSQTLVVSVLHDMSRGCLGQGQGMNKNAKLWITVCTTRVDKLHDMKLSSPQNYIHNGMQEPAVEAMALALQTPGQLVHQAWSV